MVSQTRLCTQFLSIWLDWYSWDREVFHVPYYLHMFVIMLPVEGVYVPAAGHRITTCVEFLIIKHNG